MELTKTWPVIGHDWAVAHLQKSMANHRVRHAYLITGAESIGKEALAISFAMALNCLAADPAERPCGECRSCRLIQSGNHPDMVYSETDPNTGALKIEEIRAVMQKLSLKPFDARFRIAILRDFDHARPQAQDALLKTLEEPPPHALIFLLASDQDALLPTITSRSQRLHLRPVAAATVRDVLLARGIEEAQATLLARLSGGRLGWALRAVEDPSMLEQRENALLWLEEILDKSRSARFDLAEKMAKDKFETALVLELWQTYWRDLMLLCEGSRIVPANYDRAERLDQLAALLQPDDALKALQATRSTLNLLQKTNMNVRLGLEVMFLDYPGLGR